MSLSLDSVLAILVLSFVAGVGFTIGAWLINKALKRP